MKRDLYEWLDLVGKNSKVLIIMILSLGFTGTYTAIDLFGGFTGVKKPEVVKVEKPVVKRSVIESITCPTVVCGCDSKIKEYHE